MTGEIRQVELYRSYCEHCQRSSAWKHDLKVIDVEIVAHLAEHASDPRIGRAHMFISRTSITVPFLEVTL